MEPTPTREEIPAEPDRQAQETKPQQQAPGDQALLDGQQRFVVNPLDFIGELGFLRHGLARGQRVARGGLTPWKKSQEKTRPGIASRPLT